MVRTQIQLEEEQARRLKLASNRMGVSVSELIRQGVDLVLARGGDATPTELAQRAAGVAGRFRSTLEDVSARHDDYLGPAFGK